MGEARYPDSSAENDSIDSKGAPTNRWREDIGTVNHASIPSKKLKSLMLE